MPLIRLTLLIMLSGSLAAAAGEYVIGVESQDYYPHYDFTHRDGARASYTTEVFALFSRHSGHQFVFLPLPIKRARQELFEGDTIDLLYPDNPAWADFQSTGMRRVYSSPLVNILGGTMVRPPDYGKGVANFHVLAVPRGFTPIEWLKLKQGKPFRVVEVPDALSALEMVLLGRADGADVEFNVARHLLSEMGQSGMLVMDPGLPLSAVGFHLSTIEHVGLIKEFDRFLSEHQAQIQQLKQHYKLIEALAPPSSEQIAR
ncbi:type 2 periplasmic-binding domain-containing protein [Bowmanella dokdonensis]|uniref:Solute-binding protein family 3/N-terminal domain-containing protein n=1 Tax=Bowmanella dokdonensis TaxID=751969 RepID=A0A939ILX0_9ALTE|nr:hypothetical protein [Bowmanella dokdonensis]MBN7824668.1 hypothetical protein [Bowmanella dokdonensis]